MAYHRIAICFVLLLLPTFLSAQQRFFLYFPWNDSQWKESYFGNEEVLDSLSRLINHIGLENIEGLDVTAYASPEGSYQNNMRLSRERAAQFDRLVNARFPAISANILAGGEAWTLLRERVINDTKIRPDLREKILLILDSPSINNEKRKVKLISELDKNDYRYLLFAHYRYLRCFEIILHLKEQEQVQQQKPVRETETEQAAKPEPVQVEPVEQIQVNDKNESIAEEQASPSKPIKKKPILAVSTNIPYDITYIPKYGLTSIPSFSLEYYPSNYGHWTFGADLEFPMWRHWDEHRFFQIQNLTLNTRYYFKKNNYHGLYLLANVNAARYGLGWEAKGWEGEGLGLSVGAGYKLTLYKRLFLDAGIAVGYFYSRYDPYEYGFDSTRRYYYDYIGIPEDFVRRNHILNWFGPTRIWISIGVELFSRKAKK